MIHATGNAGSVTAVLAGKSNPYGKLGVIEQGAMADMLIYSKNPLEDVTIIEDYENNLKLIIKDGKVLQKHLRRVITATASQLDGYSASEVQILSKYYYSISVLQIAL